MPIDLKDVYRSTAEDLLFKIGSMQVANIPPAPLIEIRYADWNREKLEIVRDSLRKGLTLTEKPDASGRADFYLATVETITLQAKQAGHTSILRAPAWDARLVGIETSVVRIFNAQRKHHGGFLLLIEAPSCEFMTVVDDVRQQAIVGDIREL